MSYEFQAICERCKQYKNSCLRVPYSRNPLLTPPPSEPLIGLDYITERQVIEVEAIHFPDAVMCRECRELKERARAARDD
jgi:hypothetical protein